MDFTWEVTLKDTFVSGKGTTPSAALAKLEQNLATTIDRDKARLADTQAGLRHLENVRAELGLPLRRTEYS